MIERAVPAMIVVGVLGGTIFWMATMMQNPSSKKKEDYKMQVKDVYSNSKYLADLTTDMSFKKCQEYCSEWKNVCNDVCEKKEKCGLGKQLDVRHFTYKESCEKKCIGFNMHSDKHCTLFSSDVDLLSGGRGIFYAAPGEKVGIQSGKTEIQDGKEKGDSLDEEKKNSASVDVSGCATYYDSCNCGPCCDTFSTLGCTNTGSGEDSSVYSFFEDDGMIYGTVAAGVIGSSTVWTECGKCYKVTFGPQCSTVDWSSGVGVCTEAPSDWGCQSVDEKALGSEGTDAIVMVTNRCSECYTGHFDVCSADDFGQTALYGTDNPIMSYESVDCPSALLDKLGCPSTYNEELAELRRL